MSFFSRLLAGNDDPEWREALGLAAERVGGRVVTAERARDEHVLVRHRYWVITLGTCTEQQGQVAVSYSCARACFRELSELKLLVRRKQILDRALEALGAGGYVPGDRTLASKYVVRGKPASRLRSVVSGALAAAIVAQPSVRLQVGRAPREYRRRWGDTTREVRARTGGVVRDADLLEGLVEVVREALDALVRMGAAAPERVVGGDR